MSEVILLPARERVKFPVKFELGGGGKIIYD
jgi:hypothetical protein